MEAAIAYLRERTVTRPFEKSGRVETLADQVARGEVTLEHALEAVRIAIGLGTLPEGAGLKEAQVLGQSERVSDGPRAVYDFINRLHEGADPFTVLEESAETFLKLALDRGELTLADIARWRAGLEAGDQIAHLESVPEWSARELIEWFSGQAVAYFAGKVGTGAEPTTMPDINAGDSVVPASVRNWLFKMKHFFTEVFKAARVLLSLEAAGKLDAGFKLTLAQAVGLDEGTAAGMRVSPEFRAIARGEASGIRELTGVNFSKSRYARRVDWEGGVGANVELTYQLRSLAHTMRRARGSDQARAAAKDFIGKPLTNTETGIRAVVSGESLKKMLSESAVKKSVSQQAHHEAVGNADKLFEVATLGLSRPPHKEGDKGIVSQIHHFDAPMPFEGEVLWVKLLVKEMENKTFANPLYTVAAVEIEKPSAIGLLESGDSSSEGARSPTGRPEGFAGKFAGMVEEVKQGMQESAQTATPAAVTQQSDTRSPTLPLRETATAENPAWGVDQHGRTFKLVWHGSPHKGIEKEGFKLHKIGTGEGAQAYGWGIYFAERKGVAEFYRETLADNQKYLKSWRHEIASNKLDELSPYYLGQFLEVLSEKNEAFSTLHVPIRKSDLSEPVIRFLHEYIKAPDIFKGQNAYEALTSLIYSNTFLSDHPNASEELKALREEAKRAESNHHDIGQLYRLEIPEDHELLDWDKPLSEQPKQVQEAIEGLRERAHEEGIRQFKPSRHNADGQNLYNEVGFLAEILYEVDDYQRSEELEYDDFSEAASLWLLKHGIPGLRYLDGNSRRAGYGSHNYVIWDESRLTPEAAKIQTTYQLRAFRTKRFEAAKAAGTTKLTQNQWQQVHTPEFKAWFGDWETLRAQRKVDAMPPVELQLDEKYRNASVEELRDAVEAHLDKLAQSGTTAKHPELGEIGFAKGNTGKSNYMAVVHEKLHATLDIMRVLEAAHLVHSEDSHNPEEVRWGTLYHTLVAKVSAFEREFVAIVTVKELRDGLRFYNTIAVDGRVQKSPVGKSPDEQQSQDSGSATALHGAKGNNLPPLRRVNPESVSRAVDAQTGEPLVVYHGTGSKFTQFNTKDRQFSGIFFSESQQVADGYTEGGESPTVIAAYLDLKKPLIVKGAGKGWNDLNGYTEIAGDRAARNLAEALHIPPEEDGSFMETVSTDEVARWARRKGFDGVIFDEIRDGGDGSPITLYTVFRSEQVKSATGNRGTFDAGNPDITYSLRAQGWEGSGENRFARVREAQKRQKFEATGVPQSLADEITARLERIRARELGRERLSEAAEPVAAARREAGFFTRLARRALDGWVEPIARRLEKLNPVLGQGLRRLEFDLQRGRAAAHERVRAFTDGLAQMAQAAPADYEALDLALKNGEARVRDALLIKHRLAEAWNEVEMLLRTYHARLTMAGFKVGFLENYFPRKVVDAEGLLAHFGADEAAAELINKRMERLVAETGKEPAELVEELFSGLPNNLKERTIWLVKGDTARFYAGGIEALHTYIEKVNEALALRAFFGEAAVFAGRKVAQGKVRRESLEELGEVFGMDIGRSTTAYATRLHKRGVVGTEEDARAVRDMLRARFNRAHAWAWMDGVKNVTLLTTLGHVTTTLTQLGDLAFSLYEAGVYHTLAEAREAVMSRSTVTKEEVGIDAIAEGFNDESGLSRAVDTVFKLIGFTHMDRVGKEAIMNAKLRSLREEALSGELSAKSQALLDASFAASEHAKVMDDLREGRVTPDTLFLAYSTLANFQPVSRSEYPQAYLNNSNGRILYLLKSFTLKAISAMRREGISKIVHGKTGAERVEGFRNLIWLAGLMYLLGVPVDALKDLIMGREPRLSDLHVDNLLKLVGVNRWIAWRLRDGHIFQAAHALVGPPMPWFDYPASDWKRIQKEQSKGRDADLSKLEAWKLVPIVGRPYYWWLGGGREKVKRRRDAREKR